MLLDHEARIEELEVRLSFMERTLTELDEVVRQQADEIVRLRTAVREVEERAGSAVIEGQSSDGLQRLLDERPPHY